MTHSLCDNSASDEAIDVLVGDWMSELNMPSRAFSVTEGTAPGMNYYSRNGLYIDKEKATKTHF